MNGPRPTPGWLSVSDEVALALTDHAPVVALESSLIAQGLPAPHNLDTARAAEAAVRGAGAVPATVAIEDGRLVVGATEALLERLADPERRPAKAASRDIGPLLAQRRLAATTVSATMRAAHAAGIACFATGGIGGVHRGAATSWDVSSDIDELAATPVAVICSGAKSILDLAATLELLETRRVPVVGLGTDRLPAFYSVDAGLALPHTASDVGEAARIIAAHLGLAGSRWDPPRPAPAGRGRDPARRGRCLDGRGACRRRPRRGARRSGDAVRARARRGRVGRPHAAGEHRAHREQCLGRGTDRGGARRAVGRRSVAGALSCRGARRAPG